MKRLFNILANLYVGIVVLTAFGAFLLYLLGYRMLIVQTGSMEPAIKTGAMIIVKKTDKYQIGDIVSFESSIKKSITHRIVEVDEQNVTTKGDANKVNDQAIQKNRIKSKVVKIINQFSVFQKIIRKPVFLIMLIYLPGLLIIYREIYNLTRKSFRRENK